MDNLAPRTILHRRPNVDNLFGAKLSAVLNCQRCQIVFGAKLSYNPLWEVLANSLKTAILTLEMYSLTITMVKHDS